MDEDIIFYAFRYSLGRMTYAVSTVSDCIIDNWSRISEKTKGLIVDEINTAIKKGEAGMEMDVQSWRRILLLNEAVRETGENPINNDTNKENDKGRK